ARTFPPAPAGFRHRPVTLADYPDLALALRELAAEPLAPPVQAAPPPPVHPDRPAADRRQPSVSTRSARRRRHHRAA
ncbi:hypothetical protein J0H33_02595, partial [bacterium]|nr:hypothetical protein [bacterium]